VAALDVQVAAREADLAALKHALQVLQAKYLEEIGPLYAELIPLDAAVAEAEIRAGLRAPDPDDAPDADPAPIDRPCSPSTDLKRMWRDVAKALHPDRSPHHEGDERTRYRRHSLMAEANRAYAERDEDRLRLILHTWSLDPALAEGPPDEPESDRRRRRAAALADRLVAIEAEFADLRRSAIARLKTKIDAARAQGWDLFGEMIRQIKREIAMGKATLARLERRATRMAQQQERRP
jgi:hypothetical protein